MLRTMRALFSGVLERYPNLKICLSHGGGFVPYQAGRFVHGWHVRQEPKKKLPKPPTDSLKRFYFDTITHSTEVLDFLVADEATRTKTLVDNPARLYGF